MQLPTTCHPLFRGSLAALFALSALTAARPAAASPTSCSQNSDCSKGFTCQVVGASACPAYACAQRTGTLDAQACPPPPPCNPQVINGCLPGPCNTDSDCATGMVCYGDTYQSCPTVPAPLPSCPPNAACAAPAFDAGACTTMTVKSCVPRYDVPCKVDTDCGAGFTCVPDAVTACSGGGSVGSASAPPVTLLDAGPVVMMGTVDASPPPPSCTTTTLSTSSCRANVIACTADTDCPSTWTCVPQPQGVTNVCAGPISVDGSVPACGSPAPAPAQMLCEPPYANLGTGHGGGTLSGGGSGAPVPAAAQNANGDSGASGSSSASTGAAGGCQVAAPGATTGGFSLFALLGLGALSRRRRPLKM